MDKILTKYSNVAKYFMVTPQISMFHGACYQVRCYRGLISFVDWGQRTSVDINIELWGQGVRLSMFI